MGYKIVYCTNSVCHPGGIQTVTITKANALAEIAGNEVWIVVTDNQRATPMLPISNKVHLVDLKVNYYDDDWKPFVKRLYSTFKKPQRHKERLKDLLNKICPDIVISTGTSEKNFLPRIRLTCSPVYIREFHFVSDYRLRVANGYISIIKAKIANLLEKLFILPLYNRVVVLTKHDKATFWRNDNRVVVIYNPKTSLPYRSSSLNSKTIISAGRLTNQKDFPTLVRAMELVHVKHPEWKLEIWGDGHQKESLLQQINAAHLSEVVELKGYTYDVVSHFANSSIFVLSSNFEGFSMVILEAMSCGLPVVSSDCKYGPSEIISDEVDGFLVPVGDEKKMSERINQLIEDTLLRKKMAEAALLKSQQFEVDAIIQQWMSLFRSLKTDAVCT